MSTVDHYSWAKTELARAEAFANSGNTTYTMQALAMAQVHATLAVAQAIDEGNIGATLAALDSRLRASRDERRQV